MTELTHRTDRIGRASRLAVILLALGLGVACDPDPATPDAGPGTDSGPAADAGPGDPDTGPAPVDSGPTEVDAGPLPPPAFRVRVENVSTPFDFVQSGALGPDPIGPGGTFEFEFDAGPGAKLSFATMFIPSNDYFYAPGEGGIALFGEDGAPVSGDVTAQVQLWDAGTEEDETIGTGPNQAQRQSEPNTGDADDDTNVRLVPSDTTNLPANDQVILVEIASEEIDRVVHFSVTITNVSNPTTIFTVPPQSAPLSPGVWVVHTGEAPLFTAGMPDRGEGLEAVAEDGDNTALLASVTERTGITQVVSPGVALVTDGANAFFEVGMADRGEGLEAIAEDGTPTELATSLGATPYATPEGADENGPLTPGLAYEFIVRGEVGDRLHAVNMLVPSNDWIYAIGGAEGLALFTGEGAPVSGDVTSSVVIYDVGTEVDQAVGFGLDQVQFQAEPNTGADDEDTMVRVQTENVPTVSDVIRVTVTPIAED